MHCITSRDWGRKVETDEIRTWGCNGEGSRRALDDLIRSSNRFSRYNLVYNLKQWKVLLNDHRGLM